MAWGDTRRITVVTCRSRRGDLHKCGAELGPRAGIRQTDGGRCSNTVAGQSSLELLIGSEAAPRKVHVAASSIRDRHSARHESAVIAPVEANPRPGFPRLVLQVRRLVELFVVVDAEREDIISASSRRDGASSAKLGVIEMRGNTREDEQSRESMDVRHAQASGNTGNFGIVPFNWECEGSAPKYAKVICIMGVFPNILAREDQITPQGLLQAYVEFIAPAWAERSRSRRRTNQQRIQHRVGTSRAGKHKILVEWGFEYARI